MAGFTYDTGKIGTHALHFVRELTGQVHEDRNHLADESIVVQLASRSLIPQDAPLDNWKACHLVAADCAEMVAAKLAKDSSIAIQEIGPVKSNAAQEFRTLAALLRRKGSSAPTPLWANPGTYHPDFVASIDAEPALE